LIEFTEKNLHNHPLTDQLRIFISIVHTKMVYLASFSHLLGLQIPLELEAKHCAVVSTFILVIDY